MLNPPTKSFVNHFFEKFKKTKRHTIQIDLTLLLFAFGMKKTKVVPPFLRKNVNIMSLCTSTRGLFTNSSLMIRKLILSEPGADFLFILFRALVSSKYSNKSRKWSF